MTAVSRRPYWVFNQRASDTAATRAQLINRLNLKTAGHNVATGREIISEGRPCSAVYLITEGVAIRYRILRDGQRQM